MVGMSVVTTPPAVVGDRREARRQARRAALLGAALRIVSRVGVAELTMQAVADRVGCSVGTVYTHFPSKGALVAELQNQAVLRIVQSLQSVRSRAAGRYAAVGLDPSERAAAELLLYGEFIIACWDEFPEESHLLLSVLAERDRVVPEADLGPVLGATMVLLALGRDAVHDAVEAEVIAPGPEMDRVVVGATAILGVLLTSHLGHIDATAFDHHRLTRTLWHDLLGGWGMSRGDLDRAAAEVDALALDGPLAPPVE